MIGRSTQPLSLGGIVGSALILLFFAGMAVFYTWVAVRTWRDPDRFARTASMMSSRVGSHVGRGLARGSIVVAAASICLALFCTCAAFTNISPKARVWHEVSGGFLGAFIATFPVLTCIVMFNRPRFLVVPYMRHLDRAQIRDDRKRKRS
jgi:hypothetical protein